MARATVALLVNAHLPWARHLGGNGGPQEQALFDLITDAYVPLLELLETLDRDRVPARLTISLSPTLLGMLDDPLLRARYVHHLDGLVEKAEQEERRTRVDPVRHRLADADLARILRARTVYLDEWQRDLASAFRTYAHTGTAELITSAATHAILPLLSSPPSVRAQVEVALGEHQRFFGKPPEGFWLPQCAYQPGLDAVLADGGVRWFVLDAHGITLATPRPAYGVYAPLACESGVAAFGRDPGSAHDVWTPDGGFPADGCYRSPHDAARARDGTPYDPQRARERVDLHAEAFVAARVRQVEWLSRSMDRPPIILCPYDAELFGRWWHEGPIWLERVLRRITETATLSALTPGDHLSRRPTLQRATPAASTWGPQGYFAAWLGEGNDWLYPHLHHAAERVAILCRRYPSAEERTRRALTQAVRELMLAQSGDWPFMMGRGTTAAYAVARARDHLLCCLRLCNDVEREAVDDLGLEVLEDRDNVFPALDYRVML